MEEYKTLRAPASDEFTEKRSRFIGYAQPVSTQVEAAAFIERIKKQHHDATHNVFAYLLREGQLERYSDDGEPQGTAGIPVLDVLRKQGVTNCAVVVTRYFGGILLGAGGWCGRIPTLRQLRSAKRDRYHGALCNFRHCLRLQLLWQACVCIPEWGGIVEDTQFGGAVTVRVRIHATLVDSFCAKLTDASNGRFQAVQTGECFAAAD